MKVLRNARPLLLSIALLWGAGAHATVIFTENFDGVTAPTLPSGWTNTNQAGANPFVTDSTSAVSGPNSAFVRDPSSIADTRLTSPTISFLGVSNAILTFSNNFLSENSFDGGVLEASSNGGAFGDIIALGGTFNSGGYTGSISGSFGNPLANRQAWEGNSGGFITTSIDLPGSFDGQSIQFRWRFGTDNSVSATGWRIDNIEITGDVASVPEPASLVLLGLGLAGLGFSRRKA